MFPNVNPIEFIRSRPHLLLAAILIALMVGGLLLAFNPKKTEQTTTSFGTNLTYETPSSLEHKVPPINRVPVSTSGGSARGVSNVGKQFPWIDTR